MMKRLFALLMVLVPVWSMAQMVQFGYLSYKNVLEQMPEYAKVRTDMDALKAKYQAEAKRGEEEFQKKFVDFMQGQKDFPQTILQKRQGELQSLMDNGVKFRMEAQELIHKAEKDMMAEVYKVLDNAILAVGVEHGYGYIMNIDEHNCPYINPVVGVDVTDLVRIKLGLIPDPNPAPAPAPEVQQAPAAVEAAPVPEAVPQQQPVQQQTVPQQQVVNENPEEH